MNIKKQGTAALVAAALAVGGAVALAPASSAATYVSDGVAIRSAPYTSGTTIHGRGYPGQTVVKHSTVAGSVYSFNNVYGNGTTNAWSNTTNTSTGVKGYSGTLFIR